MRLHIQQLIDRKACQEQVDLFRAKFGESVDITEELCVSVATEFNFDWAAQELLTAPALAEYECVTAQALAEYERVTAQAQAEYKRVTTQAWAEYQRGTA